MILLLAIFESLIQAPHFLLMVLKHPTEITAELILFVAFSLSLVNRDITMFTQLSYCSRFKALTKSHYS